MEKKKRGKVHVQHKMKTEKVQITGEQIREREGK